ncbi:hypothetical protein IEQ34_001528 [Dendrobium chrysotoxum]|uniref:Epidermal patterning factor-like protein n=1 Tax=Dendrobium chrysotoxum TaxID=161865 RepID=A0AAV7HRS7_DENCH|nr:hypothetical protein IEQ34_001528 [Dendrobium chrysotoxum]
MMLSPKILPKTKSFRAIPVGHTVCFVFHASYRLICEGITATRLLKAHSAPMAAIISAASFVLASASSPSYSEENASKSVKLRDDWRNRSKPIRPGGVYPAKEHCSRCGLCDTYYIAHVRDACAFLGAGMSRIEVRCYCPFIYLSGCPRSCGQDLAD